MPKSKDKKIVVPHVYLDTNVLTAFIQKEKKWYDKIIELLRYIKKEKWLCSLSYFGMMEILDNLQDNVFAKEKLVKEKMTWKDFRSSRNNRNLTDTQLNDILDKFKKTVENRLLVDIVPFILNKKGWEYALKISSESNMFAPDVIHLAIALENGSDLLVSKDSFFVNICSDKYIDSCFPDLEKVKEILKVQGFDI